MRLGSVRRSLHQKKLDKAVPQLREALARFDEEAGFLRLIWAVDALQSRMGIDVGRYLKFPEGADDLSRNSPYLIHKWELETLVALFFDTPQNPRRFKNGPVYRSTEFGAAGLLVNLLRKIENSESGVRLTPQNVLMEMHKVAHRQFEWQRKFATGERLYRFAFIYGQGACAEHFENKYGMELNDFLHAGFVLYSQAHRWPWTKTIGVEKLGIAQDAVDKALGIMSLSQQEFRQKAKNLTDRLLGGKNVPMAYLPSLLRQYPIITAPEVGTFIAPLPELVFYRMTAGLFYDVASGPQMLLTESNNRFEEYARRLLQGYFPHFHVMGSIAYGPKKSRTESPDVLVKVGDEIAIVLECKATKLTYLGQYSDDPLSDAQTKYAQIAKGVVQLWRFFADARLGRFQAHAVAVDACGVVLTLDAWMQMSGDLQDEVIAIAKGIVAADPDVTAADMRQIIFCPMQELADTAIISDEAQFMATLKNAVLPLHRGWALRSVRSHIDKAEKPQKFPFQYDEVLPWMKRIDDLAAKAGARFF